MVRRKSGFEEILSFGWQGQLVLAGFAALVATVMSSVDVRNPFLQPLLQAFRPFVWFAAIGLAALAAIKYVIEQFRKAKNKTVTTAAPARHDEPIVGTGHKNPEVTALDAAWRESIKPKANSTDRARPDKWSLDLLRFLEWKRFEILCGAFYAKRGFRVETIRCGSDGGIDAKLFFKEIPNPVAIIQCKAWSSRPVGVKPVRELLGVMTHNKVAKGIFHATGTYTDEAISFARANKITLFTGADLIKAINELADEAWKQLLEDTTEGDYTTPTCPSCGIKMVARTSAHGDFWGCSNYPRCRQTFKPRGGD